jgi:hypothetical protein
LTGFLGYQHSPKWFKYKNKHYNLISKRSYIFNNYNSINKRFYSTGLLAPLPVGKGQPDNKDINNRISNVVQDFLIEKKLKPVFIYEDLKNQHIKDKIKNDTSNLSGVYLILNKQTLDYYVGSASTDKFYSRFYRHLINLSGSKGGGYPLLCLILSNSGDILKFMMPSYISGPINNWGKAISHKMSENKIENHGSKSANIAVKEQRVNGSRGGIYNTPLRCTLIGFERNCLVRNPSNQINYLRYYSTNKPVITLDPWFVSGFTDAEGCFVLSVVKNNNYKTGWAIKLSFQIGLHTKDRAILEMIQKFFNGIGNISNHGSQMVHYRVESYKDLSTIINHFDNYPLITTKYLNFELFKQAYFIMLNKEHLTKEGLDKFVSIKATINKGLSDKLKEAFPNITALDRSSRLLKEEAREVGDIKIKNPQWLAGFATGEACFYIKLIKSSKSKHGFNVQLVFQITQHIKDEKLMKSLINYLNSGNLFKSKDVFVFEVTKFSDLTEKIVPFFKDNPILGSKHKDFLDWNLVIELMQNKVHLTREGLEQIKQIKERMNKGRE